MSKLRDFVIAESAPEPVTEDMWEKVLHHWSEVVADPINVSTGALSCVFCKSYHKYTCKECPIYKDTGRIRCQDTPYKEIVIIKQSHLFGRILCEEATDEEKVSLTARLKEAAKKEYAYLLALHHTWKQEK
jgi:hypothetical protein